MSIITVGCVLRSGGDYLPDHVAALNYSLKRHCCGEAELLCYTDQVKEVESLGVKAIPLVRNDPGWWAVPEVFRTIGSTVVIGLDTVFVRDIRPLLQIAREAAYNQFYMIRNLGKGQGPASGVMAWNGDWKWIFDEFNYRLVKNRLRGDENWTLEALASRGLKPSILQDEYDGICSYKLDVRGRMYMPDDAAVVVFHGKPRPHEITSAFRRLNYPLAGEGIRRM